MQIIIGKCVLPRTLGGISSARQLAPSVTQAWHLAQLLLHQPHRYLREAATILATTSRVQRSAGMPIHSGRCVLPLRTRGGMGSAKRHARNVKLAWHLAQLLLQAVVIRCAKTR